MTGELDALLVRNLSDLNDAANRLEVISEEVGQTVDREVARWANDNGWRCEADFHGKGKTWLAPPAWMIPTSDDDGAYIYFQLDETGAQQGSQWHLASYAISTDQQIGFWLYSDAMTYAALRRLFKATGIPDGMPMRGSEFFLPLRLEQGDLANAVESGMIADAMGPIRKSLDQLKVLAASLEPLKAAVVKASTG